MFEPAGGSPLCGHSDTRNFSTCRVPWGLSITHIQPAEGEWVWRGHCMPMLLLLKALAQQQHISLPLIFYWWEQVTWLQTSTRWAGKYSLSGQPLSNSASSYGSEEQTVTHLRRYLFLYYWRDSERVPRCHSPRKTFPGTLASVLLIKR